MSKILKYMTWLFIFIAKKILIERRRFLKAICQLDVMHYWLSKLPQKLLDEKLLLYFIQAS
jgi:hypothetical protein